MKVSDSIRMATRFLTGHRLRSALTIAGIVIGIATVIVFASFGISVQTDVVSEFEDTSASEIFVVTGEVGIGGENDGFFGGAVENFALPALTTYDVQQLGEIEGVVSVIPRGSVDVTSMSDGNQTVVLDSLTATTPAAFSGDNIVAGRAFEVGVRGEVVLSESAVERFEQNVTVGQNLTVDYGDRTETVTVVGIASQARGGFGSFGDFAPTVYVPTDPYYQEAGPTAASANQGVEQTAYRQVTLVARPNQVSDTQERVERYLNESSDATQVLGDVGITVQSTADLVDGIESVLTDIVRLVTGIGVLALLVGAFGIANIMLVSVTERTKEIGIMKANGARNREIMGLFLTESVLLGMAGAVVGIPLGLGVGFVASTYAEVGFTIPYDWILIASAMGIVTGIVSGLYPAWRAARVDPIDALRYE
ncbi:putative ABC transport system permease protein [Halovenus aranensis]|uniref:Putative ABC transport system permease protein n=1 Tax=Halovenus aranensis TaxID=890420 RepID=A0A1G8SKH1_9EURY|nr:ABC transporter permease [Halovenus aranensis]SDJ29748.1 putative ABC transport system permease protein [Halovenus aranensis]